MKRLALGSSVLAIAAGCSAPAIQWQDVSGHEPTLAEASDCRMQAGRQAELRYPREPAVGRRRPIGAPAEFERSSAEVRFYNDCMHHKGYRLIEIR